MGFWTKAGKTAVLGTVAATVTALLTAVPAQAAQRCDFSTTTGRYSCSGSGSVRNPSDVIGAKLFTGLDYSGDSLTIWVPRPCPKNDTVDHWVSLGNDMRNKVSSVQAWSSCWVWLYFADGQREGPFKGNEPDVGSWANDRAVTVGLS